MRRIVGSFCRHRHEARPAAPQWAVFLLAVGVLPLVARAQFGPGYEPPGSSYSAPIPAYTPESAIEYELSEYQEPPPGGRGGVVRSAPLPQPPLPEDEAEDLEPSYEPVGLDLYREMFAPVEKESSAKPKEKAWYEKMRIRGYAQFRYNRLGETNPRFRSVQGDRSIGEDQSFLLRRARMIFSGDAGDHVSYYIQPDFASGATGPNPLHFLQIRDFYADVFLDHAKEFRFRVGQSKVPYGFENLQSSQNRLALDRNDALNSAVVNERDLGVFFYWAPAEIRERFKYLIDSGLKGSGDYGVFGFGVYNGQTANRPERNDNRHLIARLTYPFEFANGQIFEPGISGYSGIYTIERSAGVGGGDEFLDRRGAISFVLYPQPFGLQGEYTWGVGPELNAGQDTVVRSALDGGYAQVFYKIDDVCFWGHAGTLIPFARFQRYDGGRKHEVNSPYQRIREIEAGAEYQFSKALEFTMNYTWGERTFPAAPYPQEKGGLIRMQLQWNY